MNDVLGLLWTQQDGARVAQTVIFIHISFLARRIMKMGPLLKLHAGHILSGHILSGKFINTMSCHIFEKQASNRSSNDARDLSIEISDQTSV